MTYQIYPTTAEHIVSATDAILLRQTGCDKTFVSSLLDIPLENAENALKMSAQLGLIKENLNNSLYLPIYPFINYLVTANEKQKSAILRLVLEQYKPYKLFKNRLLVLKFAHKAAEHIKVFYDLDSHREVIKDTITSLGTYTQSLISKGAGIYKIAEEVEEDKNYFVKFDEIVSQREEAEIIVRKLLGDKATNWIDNHETLQLIITAYLKLEESDIDKRSPILYSGNAFESFLFKIAEEYNIDVNSQYGINSKIDKLSREGHISKKHKFMGKYLGHIRNACDHGIDSEISESWKISQETAYEYVHVTITCIKVIIESINGVYGVCQESCRF